MEENYMENNSLVNKSRGNLEVENQTDIPMDNQVIGEMENERIIDKKTNRNLNKKEYKISKIGKLTYYILGVVEILFAFRFAFKILGANTESAFVSFIYSSTKFLLVPFTGIFREAVTDGIETKAVLEPTLIIGMIVYAVLALGIVKLIEISSHKDSNTL